MEIAKALWEFLLDPQSWEILGPLVGIVGALIGGSIIFKRIHRTKVSARNHSIAAGRDIKISGETGPPSNQSRKRKR